jgi:Leucine-rich repeat (LRR) protein
MKTKSLILFLFIFISALSNAQNIVFTDLNLKTKLLSSSISNSVALDFNGLGIQIDTNSDGEIQLTEALNVYTLDVSNSNIDNTDGLEYFTNLTFLNCSYNHIVGLNISNLSNLQHLDARNNQLTALNFTGASNIKKIYCNNNQLSQLDLSNLLQLLFIQCDENQINQLNMTSSSNINTIICNNNLLSTIDLTSLNNLLYLICDHNQLTNLNFANNPNLLELKADENPISNIDLNQIVNLTFLSLHNTPTNQINITGLPALETFLCSSCGLTQLDLTNLPNLTHLGCGNNSITQLDLSQTTNLRIIDIQSNQIPHINISNLTNLEHLNLALNLETSLDLTGLTKLESLVCNANQITQILSISDTKLNFLKCENNQLTELNLKNGQEFIYLSFENNPNLAYICHDEIQASIVNAQLTQFNNTTTEANTYCSFTPGGNQNSILGKLIFDSDNNGCDADDSFNLLNQKISINDQTIEGADFTDAQAEYKFSTLSGTFLITPILENPSIFSISPTDTTIIFTDSINNIVNKDFCITPIGIHPDLEVIYSPINVARPGFNSDYQLTYKNKGNQTLSGTINLVFNDAVLDLISTSVIPTNTALGNLNWDYTSLLPFETKTIKLVFNTNGPMETPPTNIDDTLNFVASITPDSGDETPLDNVFNLNQIIVGAYDPNIITCLEGEMVSPSEIGKYLHYVIDFENTGNFPAENVVVAANIDPLKYDINSLQVLNSSHAIKTKVTGNKIEYIFENINLEALAHGNFLIKIKSVNTLSIGDAVSQFADIYFDYNFPIQTNNAETVYNYLESGIDENDLDVSITVSPNPSNGNYIVTAENQIKSIEIYDVNGRVILTKIVNDTAVKLDISDRNKGIYYVKSISEKGASIVKIVKE